MTMRGRAYGVLGRESGMSDAVSLDSIFSMLPGGKRPSLAALASVVVVAAACGRGATPTVAHLGSTTTTTAAPSVAGGPPPNKYAALVRFAACMHDHGVPSFPTPVQNGGARSVGISPAISGTRAFRAAQSACQYLLPVAPTPPTITAADQNDYLKATRCMRAHGITGFPDPVFSGPNGVHFPIPPGMHTTSPPVLRAEAICRKLIPAGLPYNS